MHRLNNLALLFVLLYGLFKTHICYSITTENTTENETTTEKDYDDADNDDEIVKNATLRKRECILLTECYFYTKLLDHPTLPREVVEKDIKKHACGFVEGFIRNGGKKGKWLFKNDILMNILFLTTPLIMLGIYITKLSARSIISIYI